MSWGIISSVLTLIISITLFVAVYKISKYIKQKGGGKEDRINTKRLVLHSSSYGMFLLAQIFTTFVSILTKDQNSFTTMDFIAIVSLDTLSFISEVILALILYQLAVTPTSSTERETESSANSSYPSVNVADFDEHAELQAIIWNQFMRESFKSDVTSK